MIHATGFLFNLWHLYDASDQLYYIVLFDAISLMYNDFKKNFFDTHFYFSFCKYNKYYIKRQTVVKSKHK